MVKKGNDALKGEEAGEEACGGEENEKPREREREHAPYLSFHSSNVICILLFPRFVFLPLLFLHPPSAILVVGYELEPLRMSVDNRRIFLMIERVNREINIRQITQFGDWTRCLMMKHVRMET